MSKQTFLTPFINALRRMVPTTTRTILDRRSDIRSNLTQVDADRILEILQSAEAGATQELFALYRDVLLSWSHLQTEFSLRKTVVIGDLLSIQPYDKKNADDIRAADAIRDMIDNSGFTQADFRTPSNFWINGCSAMLDSVLWPISVVEKTFRPSSRPGLRYELANLEPVPDRLWNFGGGRLRLEDTDPKSGQPCGSYSEVDPRRYILHKGNLLTAPPWWGGPMRSLLFWWLLANMSRDWWARFLDRLGAPFLVGRYNESDDASRTILERAFGAAMQIGGLVVTKETEVEIMQSASQATGDAYAAFQTVCNREASKLIVGQTLSAEAQATGMNSGQQTLAQGVREDLRQLDKTLLGWTLRVQLFAQYLSINGIPGRPPLAVWGGESFEEAKATAAILANLGQAGVEPTEEALAVISQKLGFAVRMKASGMAAAAGGPLPGGALAAALAAVSRPEKIVTAAELAGDKVSRSGASDLSRAFRGSLSPIRALIQESTSPQELESKLRKFYADLTPGEIAPLLEEALVAWGANGAVAVETQTG